MRTIKKIYIHCSYTPVGMDIGVTEIQEWHKARGWSTIGYHFVIRRDGTIEKGRALSRQGAHAKGHNAHSIGICLVGGKKGNKAQFNFTDIQMVCLKGLVHKLVHEYKLAFTDVHGHNEVSSKLCPCFDVQAYFSEQ